MPTSSEYRSFAEQCLRWADETDSEEHRLAFLEMAKFGHNSPRTGTRRNRYPRPRNRGADTVPKNYRSRNPLHFRRRPDHSRLGYGCNRLYRLYVTANCPFSFSAPAVLKRQDRRLEMALAKLDWRYRCAVLIANEKAPPMRAGL